MRYGSRLREAQSQKKGLNPIWRGIGFILLIVFMVGGYYAAGVLLNHPAWPYKVPANIGIDISAIKVPFSPVTFGPYRITGQQFVQVGAALVIALLVYSIMVALWGAFNPVKLGPTDSPPIRRKIDKRKVR
jgi:uncharacterized membrane protein